MAFIIKLNNNIVNSDLLRGDTFGTCPKTDKWHNAPWAGRGSGGKADKRNAHIF